MNEGKTLVTERIPAIVITGPVGAGKSTIMTAMSQLFDHQAISHVAFDMDYLRWVHPNPAGDPFAAQLGYHNLAAIWPNVQIVSPQCVLLADVVERRSQVQDYLAAMPGTDVTIIRLQVPMPLILDRLAGRENETTIAWYRQRAPELQTLMEREQVADTVIDVGHRSPEEVAAEILQRTGTIHAAPDTKSK